jgi:hypothetical protein
MATHFHNIPNLFIGFVLLGMSSGCTAVVEVVNMATFIPNPDSMQNEPRHNYYEPEILTSIGDTIRIKYLDVNSNAQHEEAGQLMSKHCGGSYIETSRVNEEGWTIVEAECIHDTDS